MKDAMQEEKRERWALLKCLSMNCTKQMHAKVLHPAVMENSEMHIMNKCWVSSLLELTTELMSR